MVEVKLRHMDDEPLFRVIRGTPTAHELAALVGALFTRTLPAPSAPQVVSRWARSGRPNVAGRPGPGAWRSSALPR
jgi:hypothetical protein